MKLFLIDDERINNLINNKIVKKVNSHVEVTEFIDSRIAYNQIELRSPDLIFLDLNMPNFNGWDFLEKMKKNNLQFDVVILTSSVSQYDHNKAVNYNNVVAYVEKPLSLDKVKELMITKNSAYAHTL